MNWELRRVADGWEIISSDGDTWGTFGTYTAAVDRMKSLSRAAFSEGIWQESGQS